MDIVHQSEKAYCRLVFWYYILTEPDNVFLDLKVDKRLFSRYAIIQKIYCHLSELLPFYTSSKSHVVASKSRLDVPTRVRINFVLEGSIFDRYSIF